jgi:aspartyl-tRNA(Asn)/glutamyl-tRNA(Gln) amidotransferase subunit B
VIGLEVHAQVTSNAKLFSARRRRSGRSRTRSVARRCGDARHAAGANRECIRQAVRTGMAIDAQINKWSRFDRKNYFYADLAAGLPDQPALSPDRGRGRDRGHSADEKDPDPRPRPSASSASMSSRTRAS